MAITTMALGAEVTGPDRAAYEQSLTLRERTMYLTDRVADAPAWANDGKSFHYRRTARDGFEFVTFDVGNRQHRPAFDHDRLAKGLGAATGTTLRADRLPFEAFTTGPDGSIRVRIDEASYSCSLTSYTCARAPASLRRPNMYGVLRDLSVPADNTPHRSPDGRFEAVTANENIVVRSLADGSIVFRTQDGSPGNFYDPESIVWSPDSAKIAVYRVKPGFAREVYRVQAAPPDGGRPKLITQLYPTVGDRLDKDHPVVIDIAARKIVEPTDVLFPNAYQLSPLAWRADSSALSFTYNQRGHAVYRLVEGDAASGNARDVVTEKSDTIVYAPRMQHHDVGGLGREIIWMSERDGWNHLYMADGRNGRLRQLTRGDWVVRSIVHVDEARRQIIFAANGREKGIDPYFQHYYVVNFDGSGLRALTTSDAFHDVRLSPDKTMYVDLYSRTDMPPVMELRRVADGALVTEVERGDISRLLAAGWKAPERFVAKARDGKTDIHGVIIRPKDFAPGKRYPVIENIYGAGFDQFVPKRFWPFGLHAGGDEVVGMQAHADLGFIVVQIDGMGTLHRSKAFHDITFKNVGEAGTPDRILWHKAAAAKYSWYDTSRVGIYGGSLGGQNALGALLFFPEFYKAAVAYNGCHDNRLDKPSWNELWLGWPESDAYDRSSNVVNAHKLQGDLLLVSGELDMNVDPAVSMQVADALIRAGKDFEQMIVPNGGHGAGRSTEPLHYLQRRQFDFFVRKLRGETTPAWNRAAD
ncbi:S9 family peptidase [Polymorphobacter multimanifer]|uniref:S9 family peptidase n=1 Tax=Polymorphobacter multimanifer TaxID=1070431 RepID=UPI001FB0787A|nr:DPP IV N-terminal domain-containing protein [Polymorphobacter multimanifer]